MNMDSLRDQIPFSPGDWVTDKNNPTIHGYLIEEGLETAKNRWSWRMKETFAFENLVELCRRTHEKMRGCAVRAVDGYLVVRNWFFGWYIVHVNPGRSQLVNLNGE